MSEAIATKVRSMASWGATMKVIAGCLHMTPAEVWAQYRDAFEAGRATGDALLLQTQFKKAQEGNVSMLIWLGKQRLGQSDKVDTTSDNKLTVICATPYDDASKGVVIDNPNVNLNPPELLNDGNGNSNSGE
jgi:hypothetical protein